MLGTIIDFLKALLSMPRYWVVWIGLLALVNLIIPLFLLGTPESTAVLTFLLVGAALQMSIFRARGFVRLLGLGHFPWLLMIPWLVQRIRLAPPDSPFLLWLTAVVIVDSLSLVLDITDVFRYLGGERTPTVIPRR
jgi:hypothetical protein